jgi:hypothetical protein
MQRPAVTLCISPRIVEFHAHQSSGLDIGVLNEKALLALKAAGKKGKVKVYRESES